MEKMIMEFLVAYGLIFLSELGDKTQLMAISLQMKYHNRGAVLVGVTAGLVLVMGVGLLVGLILKQSLDQSMVNVVAGIIFLAAALFQLKEMLTEEETKDPLASSNKESSAENSNDSDSHSLSTIHSSDAIIENDADDSMISIFDAKNLQIIMKVASLMFLAELGDKTQIVFISLVASRPEFMFTTIGGLLALISVNALGVFFADVLTRYINVKLLNWIVFVLFVIFGLILLAEGLGLVGSNIF